MKIKDFKVGQTVTVLSVKRGREPGCALYEYTVTRVGRKYVYAEMASRPYPREFCLAKEDDEFLTAAADYGMEKDKLFPTRKEAQDYLALQGLRQWVRDAVSWSRIEGYTLEQLQAVKRILTDNHPDETE